MRENKQLLQNGRSYLNAIINTINAFVRNGHLSVVLLDYENKEIIYVSNNSTLWNGPPLKVGQKYDVSPFSDYMMKEEQMLVQRIKMQGLSFLYSLPVEKRSQHSISYDVHLVYNRNQYLTNHTFTPITFTKEGKLELALLIVSSAVKDECGNARITDNISNIIYSYSPLKHKWIEQKNIDLTKTEKEIVRLSSQGYTVEEIALKTFKSVNTIKGAKKMLFDKLGVDNISSAIYKILNYRGFSSV